MANKNFNLTPQAKEDLRSIWNYRLNAWNEEQADSYLAAIYERFSWLAKRPNVGKLRTDICEGYYYFPQGSHLVFYLINKPCIDIIGIPHKDMDVLNYFGTED